jgi:outer membrane receptor protein involved in Fe transport
VAESAKSQIVALASALADSQAQTQHATVSGTITGPTGAAIPGVSVTIVSRDTGLKRNALGMRNIGFLLWLVVPAQIALSQSTSAAVNGTVRDTSGAVISGATTVLRNVDTGIQHTTTTGSVGVYSLGDIPPGNYAARASKDGFATQERTGLILQVNQTATLDFTLPVGPQKETLTVAANVSVVDSTTSELGTVITTELVTDLPLNGRNFTQLLDLTPGVSPVSVAQNSTGGAGFGGLAIGAFSFPAVSGQRNRSNMFLLDGANDLAFLGNYNYAPIIDDIQEFKIQSNNDLAEFGGVSGGIVNVVTKAGTNSLHGAAWEFLRNEQLDARNFFLPSRNPLHQNQFGVTVGGPVVIPKVYQGKNRTFFFFAYEGFRQSQSAQTITRAPTTAELAGDFSSLLGQGIQLYNPLSTRPDPANPGEFLRDAFAGNIIPASLLSPAAELYARTLFPSAGTPIPGGNLYDTTPAHLDQDSYTGRIDESLGTHDLLFGRVSYLNESSNATAGYPGALSMVAITGWNASVHESHTFGPDSILDLQLGRNLGTDTLQTVFTHAPSNFPSSLIAAGFSPAFISGFPSSSGSVIPIVGITGYVSTSGYDSEAEQLANTWEFGAQFSKAAGRHTIKFGYSYSRQNFDNSPLYAAGEAFSAFQTSDLENPAGTSGSGTGDALASFLLGVPGSSYWRHSVVSEHDGAIQGAFIQDQYKISPRLSVNLGVRWDVSQWPVFGTLAAGNGYVGDLDLSDGTYLLSALPPPCSSSRAAPCIPNGTLPAHVEVNANGGHFHHTDYNDWQPRLGIAYRLLDTTSLRAGYGRSYDEWNGYAQTPQNIGGTWPSVGSLNINSQNQNVVTATIGNPVGLGSTTLEPAANPFGSSHFYYDPNLKTPFADHWNFEIDQQLGPTALSVIYVGERDRDLDLGAIFNTAEFPGPGNAATVAGRQPFPYITPTRYDTSLGYSDYEALDIRLSQVFRSGFTYLLSYTWSKSIDLGCSGDYGVEGCEVQDVYDFALDRSVSGFDLTNSFVGSVHYELPFGKQPAVTALSKLLRSLERNWAVNGIVSLHSGLPYDVTYQGDLANTGNTFVRANLVGNPILAHPTPVEWFNAGAFAIPAPYTFGDLGRNSLRSDWFRDLDCSLFRNFPIGEATALTLRLEAFNAFNDVVFAAPGSVINGPNFGVVTSTANSPRQVQVALKLAF